MPRTLKYAYKGGKDKSWSRIGKHFAQLFWQFSQLIFACSQCTVILNRMHNLQNVKIDFWVLSFGGSLSILVMCTRYNNRRRWSGYMVEQFKCFWTFQRLVRCEVLPNHNHSLFDAQKTQERQRNIYSKFIASTSTYQLFFEAHKAWQRPWNKSSNFFFTVW